MELSFSFLGGLFPSTTSFILCAFKADGFHERDPRDVATFIEIVHVGFDTSVVRRILALQVHNVEHVCPQVMITRYVFLETI